MTPEEAIKKFGVPYDIFGKPYTRETYKWWRSLNEKQREMILEQRKFVTSREHIEHLWGLGKLIR